MLFAGMEGAFRISLTVAPRAVDSATPPGRNPPGARFSKSGPHRGSQHRSMKAQEFALFDTAIGRCAVAWSERGILAVQLPEGTQRKTRARLVRRLPQAREAAPPPAVQLAVDGLAALLRGEASDLTAVELDMDGVPPFHRRV